MPSCLRTRLAVLGAAVAAALAVAPAVGAAEPKMKLDRTLQVATVCLPVTDPAGLPRQLYGKRYTTPSATPSTPAVVLVHGIASSTANWDFSPTWSTARALAGAGYVVYSYDRLGYARSSYFDRPGGGATLTTREHRRMLHQVVQDVKTGGYSTTATDDCAAAAPGGIRNPTVAVLGHSAGGWIVAGYPGTYHDVAAMIQTSIVGSTASSAEESEGSKGGGFTPNPAHPDYFDFFHQRSECESFNVFAPGAVRSVVDVACTPPFIPSPYGEIADLPAKLAENDVAISQIGPGTPVLLASGDHDTTAPPPDARADFEYYKAHCGCDVSQYFIPASGHLYQVHASLARTVDVFVRWLSSRGLPPTPPKVEAPPKPKPLRLIGTGRGDRLSGGGLDDVLRGMAGSDRLFGGPGNDRLEGGRGNDRLHGGAGRDRLFGGTGRDRLDARDGATDLVSCGSGRDLAIVDRRDRVRGCERVRVPR
jgi:pimeloyl-ACP methyl ester carboxylesterase